MNIIDEIDGKRVLIWGYGKEGKSTESFLKRCCNAMSIDIYEGEKEGINENNFDMIIKSPGIVMIEDDPKYTSQTELFLKQYYKRVIGITGTKGKSTTSAMLYDVLRECCDKKVIIMGNIGQPCLDFFEEITDETLVVYEMSCHQLMHTKISPHVAVFLNFYEEHLDYYGTTDRYFKAKSNIASHQNCDDYLFIGDNVPDIDTVSKVIKVTNPQKYKYSLGIIGEHNQYNAEFVYTIATGLFKCNSQKVLRIMNNFTGLPHRLEYIGTIEDIAYYDDSISTIPQATINAIKSVPNVHTILVGGMDREINYDILLEFIRNNKQLRFICSYASGKRIYESVSDCDNCFYVEDLEHAVQLAKEITLKGHACILSPAAASYGNFKNFEERGNKFKEYILNESKDN